MAGAKASYTDTLSNSRPKSQSSRFPFFSPLEKSTRNLETTEPAPPHADTPDNRAPLEAEVVWPMTQPIHEFPNRRRLAFLGYWIAKAVDSVLHPSIKELHTAPQLAQAFSERE